MKLKKIPAIKTAHQLQEVFSGFGYNIPVASQSDEIAPGAKETCLGESIQWGSRTIGNRYSILPMEGWDAEIDGQPSELVARRWLNFAGSGAKLLWGCEASAIDHACRANPRQLVLNNDTVDNISSLYKEMRAAHRQKFGTDEDLGCWAAVDTFGPLESADRRYRTADGLSASGTRFACQWY